MSTITSFKGYIDDQMKDEITDFTEEGNCSKCGNCCTNLLPMNKKEIDRIKKYIKTNGISENKNLQPFAYAPVDMTCPLMDIKSKTCTIYEVRPKVCRLFICNKPKQAKENRDKLSKSMQIISVRNEFFTKQKE